MDPETREFCFIERLSRSEHSNGEVNIFLLLDMSFEVCII
jgi:hypothetical protein